MAFLNQMLISSKLNSPLCVKSIIRTQHNLISTLVQILRYFIILLHVCIELNITLQFKFKLSGFPYTCSDKPTLELSLEQVGMRTDDRTQLRITARLSSCPTVLL